ncbi:MAG: DoxX family protein [Saprospiraceae bacterium]|nr:DoxX family protein [Saprospiraceae bacterium]
MAKNYSTINSDNIFLALFRIVVPALMLFGHGLPKLLKYIESGQVQFGDPIGIGVNLSFFLVLFAEVICSILIILGFKTRLATIPLIVTMLVVIFVVKLNDSLSDKETPILYLTSFALIYFLGGGKYSIDNYRK